MQQRRVACQKELRGEAKLRYNSFLTKVYAVLFLFNLVGGVYLC